VKGTLKNSILSRKRGKAKAWENLNFVTLHNILRFRSSAFFAMVSFFLNYSKCPEVEKRIFPGARGDSRLAGAKKRLPKPEAVGNAGLFRSA